MSSEPNRTKQSGTLNGDSDAATLQSVVQSLQADCAELRDSLAKVERERDLYLKALYEQMRPTFQEFADVDIDQLKKESAGPVELIDENRGLPA